MASQYNTTSGTLVIPGAYVQEQVVANQTTLAVNGVIFAIGEADQGPSYAQEADLTLNTYGPDQLSDIITKYGSGQIVDAFNSAVDASNDNNITGGFTSFIPIKTNASVAATGVLTAIGSGTYANIVASGAGAAGNLITYTTTATAEVAPSTGGFILASPQQTTTPTARANGAASLAGPGLTAGNTPAQMVTAINGSAWNTAITASGGVARTVLGASTVNITVSAAGSPGGLTNTFTNTSGSWSVTPTAGDIMFIPTGAPWDAGDVSAEGSWVVLSATSTIITAYKLLNISGTGNQVTATTTAPVTGITAAHFECYSPVTIAVTGGTSTPGLGKSLEICDPTSGGLLSYLAYQYTSATTAPTAVSWISKVSAPQLLVSSVEYQVNLNTVQQAKSINENLTGGGSPVLSIGYAGTTASAVIANGVMTLTLVGGSSSGLSPIAITLANYPTIGTLCQYIGSLAGFTAAPTLLTYTSVPSTSLDPGTYSFATTNGAMTGRIKNDGYDFLNTVNNNSVLVDIIPVGTALYPTGIPSTNALTFMSGGSRGSTANSDIQSALNAIQAVQGNFVVPLFSQSATLDSALGLTSASSSYDISSINSALRSHVLLMSQFKQRRRRLGLMGVKDTFVNDQNFAGNTASARMCVTFQSVNDNNASGTLTTFQPWMAAIKAAAMQAAGGYRDITKKYITISGYSASGYNPGLVSNVETALEAGLLPIGKDNGGYYWVNDQTTYSVDSNFVYNSLQAMYAADIVASTVEQRMERAFVGQSLADVSAALATTVFGSIMDDIRTLKYIAPSDDAPRGFKNTTIKVVNGNAMVITSEIKLTTSIKFIPITFMITAIQQTATS